MIEMDEKIVGIWFLATIPGSQDWMAGLSEIEPDAKYKLTYRFRYYGDDGKNPFEGGDRRSWYDGTMTGTRAYCIAAIRQTGGMLASVAHEKLYEVMNNGDLGDFMRRFQDQPWAFMRVASGSPPFKETRPTQSTTTNPPKERVPDFVGEAEEAEKMK